MKKNNFKDIKFKYNAWIEVNLKNFKHNLNVIKSYMISPRTSLMVIVKGNAYGHGAIEISKYAIENSADYLGVAFINEGIKLRKAKITAPIIVLRDAPSELIKDAIENNLILSVSSFQYVKNISKISCQLNKISKIDINVNTGMNRLGIYYNNAVSKIIEISSLPNIKIHGLFTHFSCAEYQDNSYTNLQWERFNKIINELKNKNIKIDKIHCANSAAFIRNKEMHLNMVRTGIIIYGLNPFSKNFINWANNEIIDFISKLKPILSFKTRLSFLKKLKPNEFISYSCAFKTKRNSIIGTIPVGYADGYSRLLSNKSKVMISGEYAPVIGNITMDQLMIDLTDIYKRKKPITIGEEITLIGNDKKKTISANYLARLIGTINYEILTNLNSNIPRIYLK